MDLSQELWNQTLGLIYDFSIREQNYHNYF
jgi:hypothetical protein